MKTSTKLLIVLFACIPLSMFAYSYLLKQEFTAGNFTQDIYKHKNTRIYKSIAPFKHLVIDGNLYVSEESSLTKSATQGKQKQFIGERILSIGWDAPVEIIHHGIMKAEYSVLPKYKDVIKTKIKNDTLYVSFFKKNGTNTYWSNNDCLLKISNPQLISVNLNSGTFVLKDMNGQDLNAVTKNAKVTFKNSSFKQLEVSAELTTTLNIQSNKIDVLRYSLLDKSNLLLEGNQIKKLLPLVTDSLSQISIKGNAHQMQQFLQNTTAKQINNY